MFSFTHVRVPLVSQARGGVGVGGRQRRRRKRRRGKKERGRRDITGV